MFSAGNSIIRRSAEMFSQRQHGDESHNPSWWLAYSILIFTILIGFAFLIACLCVG